MSGEGYALAGRRGQGEGQEGDREAAGWGSQGRLPLPYALYAVLQEHRDGRM